MTGRSYRVRGGGGIELYVEETGNQAGRPVLLIHGISQCRLAWNRQVRSTLADDLRIVVFDLRGHGLSDRPHDGYGEASLWADDVNAVITALSLERPVLCGWSYGGVVIGDYLQRYGEAALGGINLVGAASRLGEPAMPYLGPDFVAALPGLFSTDVETSTATLDTFIRITTATDPSPEDFYLTLGYNSTVPPHVRQYMLSRTLNHDDQMARLTTPVLITHGLADRIVLPTMSEHNAHLIPDATTSYYSGIGHAPFLEDPDRFNAELLAFVNKATN
jgi:pimeloyl-ACP methyl ester carboxylesterase